MKFIYFKKGRFKVEHPVGENIETALEYVSLVAPHIKKIIGDAPTNIWCQGSSGAILSAFLVKELDNKFKICHVKKPGEKSHHDWHEKIFCVDCKNIILDDFMRSGNTVQRIYEAFFKETNTHLDALILGNGYDDIIPKFSPNYIIIDQDTGKYWKKLYKL